MVDFLVNELYRSMKYFQKMFIFDTCFSINSTITCKDLNRRFPHRLDILKSPLPLANYLAEIKTWFITPPVTGRDCRSWIIRNTIINNRWICIYGSLSFPSFITCVHFTRWIRNPIDTGENTSTNNLKKDEEWTIIILKYLCSHWC